MAKKIEDGERVKSSRTLPRRESEKRILALRAEKQRQAELGPDVIDFAAAARRRAERLKPKTCDNCAAALGEEDRGYCWCEKCRNAEADGDLEARQRRLTLDGDVERGGVLHWRVDMARKAKRKMQAALRQHDGAGDEAFDVLDRRVRPGDEPGWARAPRDRVTPASAPAVEEP